jgi:uncharacterized protein YuzE
MRITHDRRTNTVYIYLTDYDDGDVARWYVLVEHDVKGDFTFDFDKSGRLLGIEVKFAAQGLPPDFLEEAEVV